MPINLRRPEDLKTVKPKAGPKREEEDPIGDRGWIISTRVSLSGWQSD